MPARRQPGPRPPADTQVAESAPARSPAPAEAGPSAQLVTNADVARVFNEIADMMEIQGDDSFRIASYRRVARAVEDYPGHIRDLAARGELETLAGVGKGSAQKIHEFITTGRVGVHEALAAQVPTTLLQLTRIPGLGPKKATVLWKERGITSLRDLRVALDSGALAGLKGFAARSIEQLREGLEFVERSRQRTRLDDAAHLAELLRRILLGQPGVRRVEPAGSLRRGCETVGDLDLLCIADDGPAVVGTFTQLGGVLQVLGAGETKASVRYQRRAGREIQVDLRVVPETSFGCAWQYFTGSKEHNVRLRELAARRGWTLNEYALADVASGAVIASRTEEEVYAALGLPWIPPELREDRGELLLPGAGLALLAPGDIRGDLHMHTTASDGRASAAEMVAAAAQRGYAYVCLTDHSPSSVIARGLTVERLHEQIRLVRSLAQATPGMTVWVGAEVDIHADGSLDYPDDVLAGLDFVVASIHAGQGRDIEANTRRALAAIRNPYVNLLAHPTGRLLNRRDAMPLDIDAVAREAARTGTALEINASSFRLDLRDAHARRAIELGATLCIDTDAHSVQELDQMVFGVITARRAGARREHVLNTRSAREVAAFVAAKRRQTG
jgi:DNA polymerase (family 10)